MPNRRTLLTLLAVALLTTPSLARAQPSPARSVEVIVPSPPGSTTDVVARLVSTRLCITLGQTFVIENRAGAGEATGSDLVTKSPPDDCYFVVSNIADHGVGPSVDPAMPYDSVRDLSHIGPMTQIPSVLAVNADGPIRTLADFIAAAKARSGQLMVASPCNGTSSRPKQEILKRSAGIDAIHVRYRGSGPLMNNVAAGQVDAMMTTLVEAGRNPRFRLLAVTEPRRVEGWPDLPTFVELGNPDLVASIWFGLSGPAGLPAAIVAKLNEEMLAAFDHTDVVPHLIKTGSTPRRMSAAKHTPFVASGVRRWAAVVRVANMRLG